MPDTSLEMSLSSFSSHGIFSAARTRFSCCSHNTYAAPQEHLNICTWTRFIAWGKARSEFNLVSQTTQQALHHYFRERTNTYPTDRTDVSQPSCCCCCSPFAFFLPKRLLAIFVKNFLAGLGGWSSGTITQLLGGSLSGVKPWRRRRRKKKRKTWRGWGRCKEDRVHAARSELKKK